MTEFGHWLIKDDHWIYVVAALSGIWFLLVSPVVDDFLSHRRAMKETELKLQLSREAEARERNKNPGLHFD